MAQNLYTAQDGGGGGGLYLINPTTGAPTLIGALHDSTNNPYNITGLAQFGNGAFYGVTSNLSPTKPAYLVTVNANTALVTAIGPLSIGGPVNDIVFLPNGTLFGYGARLGQYVTINTTTGKATAIGSSLEQQSPNSLAVSTKAITLGGETTYPAGTVFAVFGGPCGYGELDTVDTGTGQETFATSIAIPGTCNFTTFSFTGLRFSSAGVLYGLISDSPDPWLVTINPVNGNISTIGNGSIPAFAGSLSFATPPVVAPVLSPLGLSIAGVGLALLALLLLRQRADGTAA